jgi:FkbM family methyltransferase
MKGFVQSVLGKFGYRLVRTQPPSESPPLLSPLPAYNLLDRFFSVLQELGFQPLHILDVGANRGGWTRQALRYFPHCAYTLIEPQAQLQADIADLLASNSRLQWITAGVGSEHKTLKFTICDRDDSSNFRFSSQEAADHGLSQIEVEVFPLNDIIDSLNAPIPDMVKIDAEGFDLKVISGASKLIGKTEIFLLESGICARGIENTLARTIAVMERLGYVPFDITDLNRSPTYGVLWLCEMAFIKRDSSLLKSVRFY